MSFGDPNPNNPYGQQPGQPQQPGYGYPQAPQGVPQQGYGYPTAPPVPGGDYGQQPGYGARPPLASWGRRVGAYLVDILVIGVPYGILMGVGGAVGGGAGVGLVSLGVLVCVGGFLFKLYKEGTTGQWIGKKALGISLLREADGRPLGFGMAFVRQIAHFLDSIACYLGWLWPLWDDKNQTFADKVCSSVVVRVG